MILLTAFLDKGHERSTVFGVPRLSFPALLWRLNRPMEKKPKTKPKGPSGSKSTNAKVS